ncbi:GumC family protein [Hufsiella ginkgonis]|uniref:Polysaccharide biosynthesis tyrosine autokinase n=1 Tax=Hufsiella ginkgonis TaxID=2695274 RepID=A0A7K1XS87_9SPHI|nr:Wzz/FepE/Etk N-terminal domain-containing protein [Hufsiella ginkgonis]MXV13863.1 hypothetical protein [Hufsiella ginkgonis]
MENYGTSYQFSPVKVFRILLSRWHWIAASTGVCLLLAGCYLRLTPPLYETSAMIRMEDNASELSILTGILTPRGYSNRIQAESAIFKSQRLLLKAIAHLDWKVSYFRKSAFREIELYRESPVQITILEQERAFYDQPAELELTGPNQYRISYRAEGRIYQKNCSSGEPVHLPGISFLVRTRLHGTRLKRMIFRFNRPGYWCGRLKQGLNLNETAKFSPVGSLSKIDPNPVFAAEALNALAGEYVSYDLWQKTQSAAQIIGFLDQQLAIFAPKADSSGKSLEEFRKHTDTYDLPVFSNALSDRMKKQREAIELGNLQLSALDKMENALAGGGPVSVLRLVANPAIDALTFRLNSLTESAELLGPVSGEHSPAMTNTRNQLISTKRELKKMLQLARWQLENVIATNLARQKKDEAALLKLPAKAREMELLTRNYGVDQKIFSFLTEKRLEAQIGKASILPGAALIDPAIPDWTIVSPSAVPVWRAAWVIGILTGAALIFLVRSLYARISDAHSVQMHSDIPLLGVVPHLKNNAPVSLVAANVIESPGSVFSGSIKHLRDFPGLLAGNNPLLIGVSSANYGEGKTLIAFNLAASFSLVGKKVLFIAADIARRTGTPAAGNSDPKGLSDYLSGDTGWRTVIQPTNYTGCEVIYAGNTTLAASDLFQNGNFAGLLDTVKFLYDLVIVDTGPICDIGAPAGVLRCCDMTLFVLRSGFTPESSLSAITQMRERLRLKNCFLVLNNWQKDLLYADRHPGK